MLALRHPHFCLELSNSIGICLVLSNGLKDSGEYTRDGYLLEAISMLSENKRLVTFQKLPSVLGVPVGVYPLWYKVPISNRK